MSITKAAESMAAITDEVRTGETDAVLGVVALSAYADEMGFALAQQSGSPLF